MSPISSDIVENTSRKKIGGVSSKKAPEMIHQVLKYVVEALMENE